MKLKFKLIKALSILSIFVFIFSFLPTTLAAPLTSISNTMSRLRVSETSNHTIVFTAPSGISSGQTVTLAFPASSFTMGASLSGVTINGNVVTSASWSAPTLTITASGSSTVAPGNVATIVIPSAQITNPSTPGTYIITIGGTFGDTGKFAVAIVGNDSFTVNANVDPTLTFALDSTSVNFGTLSSTSVSTAVSAQTSNSYVRTTISTNANGGYTLRVRSQGNGSNPGLHNASANFTIGSADYSYNSTANLDLTHGYGLQAVSAGATILAPYNGSSNNVGGFQRTAQALASHGNVVADQTIDLILRAKVSGATPAGSYVDSVTLIATANF